jgi:ornithine decarboxylase
MKKNVIPLEPGSVTNTLEQPVINFSQAQLLSQTHPTPFLVLSPTRIIKSIKTLREYLPGVKIFYAMKSNPNPAILQIIKNLVDGIDVASYGESSVCREAGISSADIIHTNPVKKEDDLASSVKQGINWFVLDNMEEIKKIKRLAPNANLLLRIAITNPHCIVNLSAKFGAQEQDVLPILKKAKAEGLNIRGISFHVGSQCTEPEIYHTAVKYARKIFDDAIAAGFTFDTLDVGGGFPISYRENLPELSVYCTVLKNALKEFFPEDLNILMEPGRCISAGCITLVTKVIGRTVRYGVNWYYIDDGVYGAFSGKLFDHCDYRIVSDRPGPLEECIVAGPTCDSIDIVAQDQPMPKLSAGDLILAPGMGAYTIASATSFNGFAPPKTIIMQNENQVREKKSRKELIDKRQNRFAAFEMEY